MTLVVEAASTRVRYTASGTEQQVTDKARTTEDWLLHSELLAMAVASAQQQDSGLSTEMAITEVLTWLRRQLNSPAEFSQIVDAYLRYAGDEQDSPYDSPTDGQWK
jgi:hypothetical protein